jgi:hypothetical protein
MGVLIGVVFSGLLRIRTERDSARENLSLFRAEQDRSQKLGTELGDVVQRAGVSVDLINADTMLSVLEKGLRGDLDITEKNQLMKSKATLLFTLQEFNAAHDCFVQVQNPERLSALLEISAKYAKLKPDDQSVLSEQDLAELLIVIRQQYFRYKPDQTPMFQYIYYHHMKRRPNITPEEYTPLASVMLDQLNEIMHASINPLKIYKGPNGYRLDLSGKHYMKFRLDIMGGERLNILAPFGTFESLDISHTPLIRMTELAGVDARQLRMVGLDLAHAHVVPERLRYMRSLKELSIDLHQYPTTTQEELKKKYRVIAE